jgi:hypothetical protein
MSDLARLQQWMQAVVTHPGEIGDALAAAPELRAEQAIRPSPTLSPAERLAIYQGMYPLRMEEALRADYPGLAHLVGDEAFAALARAYVAAWPSRSYTLNRLGDHLPEFLRSGGGGLRRPDLLADLATLERAVSEVFDADETPPLTEAEIAAVAPEAWAEAVLEPIAALRLLELRYPVGLWLDAIRAEGDEHRHPKLSRRDSRLVVYRRNYAVYREELEKPAHALLADLLSGRSLGEALEAALGRPRAPQPERLTGWFRQWASAGLFRAVRFP